MPYRTESGTHYHMTYGCCRATISCGTEGLKPCATCCGKAAGGAAPGGGGDAHAGGHGASRGADGPGTDAWDDAAGMGTGPDFAGIRREGDGWHVERGISEERLRQLTEGYGFDDRLRHEVVRRWHLGRIRGCGDDIRQIVEDRHELGDAAIMAALARTANAIGPQEMPGADMSAADLARVVGDPKAQRQDSLERDGDGWRSSLDLGDGFVRHAASPYGQLDDEALRDVMMQWYGMRVADCEEDIMQVADELREELSEGAAADASLLGAGATPIRNEHEPFLRMYEIADGDRRVVVILDSHCVRWHGFAKGEGLRRMPRGSVRRNVRDGEWTGVGRRHEFTDEGRGRCARAALGWLRGGR